MKLHYLPGAVSLAGHIVLEWIGVPYEAVRMRRADMPSPTSHSSDAEHPVPMLEHGELALTEDVAILGYLADLHPEAGLLGDGTRHGRAEVMRWLGFLDHEVRSAFMPIFAAPSPTCGRTAVGPVLDNVRRRIHAYLERLDAQMTGRDWLVGTRSIADPYLLVVLRWAVGLDVSLFGLGDLMRFARHVEADPGVQAAILAEEEEALA